MALTRVHAELIADGEIDTPKIADLAITEEKIADNAVTDAKAAPIGSDAIKAAKIAYSNIVSGISAYNVQEAIDYLNLAGGGGGGAGSQATYTRQNFVATAGQTTFTITEGYTLGYLQVYMNGVLLTSDYTANDQATVVFSEGLAAGTEVTTLALDSLAISELLRVFNISPSSPDASVTIDGSGNVLVGKTQNDFTLAGSILRPGGEALLTREGDLLTLNRLTSDGGIVSFRKDGAPLGNIGTEGGDLYVGNGTRSLMWTGTSVFPRSGTGSLSDGTVDLGNASNRFKDLHLSGGLYLGGEPLTSVPTDSIAYEEGTFNFTLTGSRSPGSASYSKRAGRYTKIGRQVHIEGTISATNFTGAGDFIVSGLPIAYLGGSSVLFSVQWDSCPFADYLDSKQQVFGLGTSNTNIMFRASSNNYNNAYTQLQCKGGGAVVSTLRICGVYTAA